MAAVDRRITRPVLRYHGGKFRLADWIQQHLPEHRTYCEPYGGAASVLMTKPRSYAEIYNELDGDVANVFLVLRDPVMSARLARALYLTPYARSEFDLAYSSSSDPVERARRTIVRSFMGFSTSGTTRARTGFRAKAVRQGQPAQIDWTGYPECIGQFCERLRGVVIEQRDALEVLRHQDEPETLFYVDPPYPHATRALMRREGLRGSAYRHDLSDDDHRALAHTLRGLRGMIVISGYPCDLYDLELFPDWLRVERDSYADGGLARTEVLWLNQAAQAALARRRRADLFAVAGDVTSATAALSSSRAYT